MRNIFVSLLLFSIQIISYGQEKKAPLEIVHIRDSVYVFITSQVYKGTPFPSNSMYVVTRAGVVMIDSPWDSTQFQPILDSIMVRHQQPVVMCISTHYHEDRTRGLDFYRAKGIRTYSSVLTKELCRQSNFPQAEFTFTKDTSFLIGGQRIETFYPGEGHTRDNLVIWVANEKILFGGCLVKSMEADNLGNVANGNLDQYGNSIRRVQKKYPSARIVIPGHQGWKNTEGLAHTLELLKTRKG